MTRFIISILILLTGLTARAQNGPLKEDLVRKVLVEDYLRKFAEEANAMQDAGDLQDVYGYFMPKKERGGFFKKWKKQVFRVEGSKLIVMRDSQIAMEIEMLDLFEQKYRINGVEYQHNWEGKASLQRDLIRHTLEKSKSKDARLINPVDWLLPKANAVVWFAPIVIQACVEGGCQMAFFLAQRAAIYVATNPAVQMAAAGAAVRFRTAIMAAGKVAVEKTGQFLNYVVMDLRTHPEIAKAIETAMKLKVPKPTPSNLVMWTYKGVIRAPIKAAAWILEQLKNPILIGGTGFGIGTILAPQVNEQLEIAKKNNIPSSTAISCVLRLQKVLECAAAKPKVELGQGESNPPEYWCPTNKANEFQIYTAEGENRLIRAIRVGTEGDQKGKPVSAMRYIIKPDGKVDLSSIRIYDIEGDDISKIAIPKFNEYSKPGESFMPDRNDVSRLEDEVTRKIMTRDRFLKYAAINHDVVMEGAKKIKAHTPDPLKGATDSELKQLDQEVAWAKDIPDIFKRLAPACTLLKGAQEDTEKAKADAVKAKGTK